MILASLVTPHRLGRITRSLGLTAATMISVVACGAPGDPVTSPTGDTNTGGENNTSQTGTYEPAFDSTRSFVRIVSEPGEYVGEGKTFLYTPFNAIIIVKADTGHLGVRVVSTQNWAGSMFFAGLSSLRPGSYTDLTTYNRNQSTSGIEWITDGKACTRFTGAVTIDSVRYDADSVSALDMTFEQRCEFMTPVLHGKVHWRAADDFTHGPVVPIPASLWQPNRNGLPTSGSYVFLQSDPGDPIGGGKTSLLTPPKTSILVQSAGGRFSVTTSTFTGVFATMNTITAVTYGFYPNVMLRDSHNPVFGGMTWSAVGAPPCTSINGWYAVDRVGYAGQAVTSLDLRFEQHCDGLTPALRGAVHWSSD